MGVVSKLQLPVMWLHHLLYVHTRGLVGHRLLGVPTLLLHTVGRRSGAPRTSGLVYARDGGAYLVVASNGGADRAPGWLFNVQANPAVEVQVGRRRSSAVASVVGADDADHERVWALVNGVNRDRFARYQRRTGRPIPVVRLTPPSFERPGRR